jgi:hypothetical protein
VSVVGGHGAGGAAADLPCGRGRNARRRQGRREAAGARPGGAGAGVLHGGAGGAVPLPDRAACAPATGAAPAAAAAAAAAAGAGGAHGRPARAGARAVVRRPARERRRRLVMPVLKN